MVYIFTHYDLKQVRINLQVLERLGGILYLYLSDLSHLDAPFANYNEAMMTAVNAVWLSMVNAMHGFSTTLSISVALPWLSNSAHEELGLWSVMALMIPNWPLLYYDSGEFCILCVNFPVIECQDM